MTRHRLISSASFRSMRWKNGGGTTTELWIVPDAATLDGFVARASIADVAAGGPFSTFAGIDRTLVLLDGRGVELVGDGHRYDLAKPFATASFRGELPLVAQLKAGPVRDFNLMVRRSEARGSVDVADVAGTWSGTALHRLCFAAQGSYRCEFSGAAPVVLAAGDALVVDGGGDDWTLALRANEPDSRVLVASVLPR